MFFLQLAISRRVIEHISVKKRFKKLPEYITKVYVNLNLNTKRKQCLH